MTTESFRVGVTGTRKGATEAQESALRYLLAERFEPGAYLHHGACVGVDSLAGEIADELGYREVVHPPENLRLIGNRRGDERRAPLTYLERSAEIVSECDLIIGVPEPAVVGGGTDWTIRLAKNQGVSCLVIDGDGVVQDSLF